MTDLPSLGDAGEESAPEPETLDEELWPRLAFHVGGQGIVHDPERVGELVRDPVLHPVPNAPPALAGLLNSRGRVVPVYDIRHSLTAGGRGPGRSRGTGWAIVLYDQAPGGGYEANDCTGLVVDDMPLQLRLRLADGMSTAEVPDLFRPWCRCVYEQEGVPYAELDMIGLIEAIRTGDAAHGNHGGDTDTRAPRIV